MNAELTLKPCGRGNWKPIKATVATGSGVLVGMRIEFGGRYYWVASYRVVR